MELNSINLAKLLNNRATPNVVSQKIYVLPYNGEDISVIHSTIDDLINKINKDPENKIEKKQIYEYEKNTIKTKAMENLGLLVSIRIKENKETGKLEIVQRKKEIEQEFFKKLQKI